MDTRVAGPGFNRALSDGLHGGPAISEDLRVIVSIIFDPRASPDDVSTFKSALIHCPSVLDSAEVSGSFDFIIEATFPNMSAYNSQLHCMAGRLAALVDRYETSFIGRRFVSTHQRDRAIWVPIANGLKRIDFSIVDKVRAEGDYMLIYSADSSWMVHSTLHSLVERLPADEFVQINRSILVRYDFIGSVMREKRGWFALLDDGTQEPISKTRVVEILRTLRSPTSKRGSGSSKGSDLVDLQSIS